MADIIEHAARDKHRGLEGALPSCWQCERNGHTFESIEHLQARVAADDNDVYESAVTLAT